MNDLGEMQPVINEWECREGFTKSTQLPLGNLLSDQVIFVETAAQVSDPTTKLVIKRRGDQPHVLLAYEDGMSVHGEPIRLMGSCAVSDWRRRRDLSEATVHKGLLIPGGLMVFNAGDGLFTSHSWVKGWRVSRRPGG